MEVHHHPHVEKKNFKEYFFEFLMIFLAVTLGFIAENIREHITETKSAHQYLHSFRNDLLQNQIQIKKYDSLFTHELPVYDSIVTIFYEKTENKNLPLLGRLLLYGQVNRVITISTPTYQQLISSGSMRYLNNAALKESMANYEESINSLVNYNDRIISTLDNQLEDVSKIEDMHDFWNVHKNPNSYGYTPDMQPFNLTKKERNFIIEYNKLFSVQAISDLRHLKTLIRMNDALVKLINKELN
ncbi:MAG TPA: hypothetical protein VMU83_03140 [Hanamia sp.]|nr:hypothetical protein [Hanamia sp.]